MNGPIGDLMRARAGARRLDHHFGGPQWALRVDVNALTIASAEDCILGQVFGDYSDGLEQLKLMQPGKPTMYGFVSIDELRWRGQIRRRQRKAARKRATYAKAA